MLFPINQRFPKNLRNRAVLQSLNSIPLRKSTAHLSRNSQSHVVVRCHGDIRARGIRVRAPDVARIAECTATNFINRRVRCLAQKKKPLFRHPPHYKPHRRARRRQLFPATAGALINKPISRPTKHNPSIPPNVP